MGTDKKARPKGGRKGGTSFPRYGLDALLDNVESLLKKVHTGPITIQQLSSGVFKLGASSGAGKTRFAAMKRFGLATGEYNKITATNLCREIGSKTGDERLLYLQQALFNVKPFKGAFHAFTGDTIPKEKIAEYAFNPLKVHPENKQAFAEVFCSSAVAAGLATVDGNMVSLVPSQAIRLPTAEPTEAEEIGAAELQAEETKELEKERELARRTLQAKGAPNISIAIDSSLDPEKLAKQLEVLKRYGLI